MEKQEKKPHSLIRFGFRCMVFNAGFRFRVWDVGPYLVILVRVSDAKSMVEDVGVVDSSPLFRV